MAQAFHNASDMVEEDAADLQFPKDNEFLDIKPGKSTQHTVQFYKQTNINLINETSVYKYNCASCNIQLNEPYISCVECTQYICLACFCRGAETKIHKNVHSYKVIHDDNVKVFSTSSWSANEEKKLLDLLLINGFGNWEDIGRAMRTKTSLECQQHYLNHYFGGIFEKTLGISKENYKTEQQPYLFKMKSLDPPRFNLDNVNFKRMAGYRCARGDFDTPYDPSAEAIISHLDINDDNNTNCDLNYNDVSDELNCAVFRAYNNRLTERQRRYKIMKDHGLLVTSKTLQWLSKHTDAVNSTRTGPFTGTGKLISFMQLMSPVSFDLLVEGLQYACDLKKYIFRLYDIRKNGIKTFQGGQIYRKLQMKRITKMRNKEIEQYENLTNWRHLISNYVQGANNIHILTNGNIPVLLTRRKASPLEILGLNGYDKLNEDERNLCSAIRLVPLAYLEYKHILISENSKHGYLRLADARRLIKIDVNKTRQIYDFLLKHGFINKPFS